MKTRELIRQLTEADPSGEAECNVDGHDIHFVHTDPGYWDGPYEVLIRDPAKEGKCYSVVGAKSTTEGVKLRIRVLSIEDALLTDPRMPVEVDYSYVRPNRAQEFLRLVEEWRKQAHYVKNSCERTVFVGWATKNGVDRSVAAAYFDAHYTHETEMPLDIVATWEPRDGKAGTSYAERREMQWSRELRIENGAIISLEGKCE